jgi:DNA-sulfur modification-associated
MSAMPQEQLFAMVPDLLRKPLERRGGGIYRGRFQIPDPQWLLNPDDLHASAALSVRDIVTAIENRLVWTDQLVQRGIRPEKESDAKVELCVADGYPDRFTYVFYPEKSDEIAEKLLDGQPGLRLSPLVWNLRPGRFQAAFDADSDESWLYLYRGRIYLPDGHHRHQAILKAFKLWEEAPDDYPAFDAERQFTVDIYFMSRQDEAEYFFQKNVLSRSVERSKSFDLTEQDALSVLAKRVIDNSDSLRGNVNRVTDRLAASNPQVVTLSTLREMMLAAVGTDEFTEDDIARVAPLLGQFWEMLAAVRPELRRLDVTARRDSRRESMAGQAVVMYGYAELMRRFLRDAEREDLESAIVKWTPLLDTLRKRHAYTHPATGWRGDFFARQNPLWREIGVLQTTKSGGETVSNVRQTREQTARVLTERLNI